MSMVIYILIALFIFLGGLTSYAKCTVRVGIVGLFLLTALREPSLGGYDVLIYKDFFNQIPPIGQLSGYVSSFSVGYTWLNACIKFFSPDYIVFQIVYSAISLYLLYVVISKLDLKDSEKCFWLFGYFCFHFFWNTWVTYRQNLSNLLFWLFIVCFMKAIFAHHKAKAIFFLLVSVLLPPLLHTSAWANLALLPLCWLFTKIDVKKLLWLVPLGCLVLFLNSDFIYSHLLGWLTSGIDERYSMYLSEGARGLNLINLLLKMFFFMWFSWFYNREKYPYKSLVLSTTAITVLLGSVNAELMARMYEYYALGFYTCVALVFRHISQRSKLLALPLFVIGFLVIFIRSILIFDNGEFLHYQLFF